MLYPQRAKSIIFPFKNLLFHKNINKRSDLQEAKNNMNYMLHNFLQPQTEAF